MEIDATRDRWGLVAATGLAVFMAMLDMSVVTLALPVIERDLGAATTLSQWVVLAYLVPLIALALPSGRWLDQVGRRQTLVLAVTGFAGASVLAGLAPNIGWLIAARVIQGAFGAALFALTPVLATIAVRPGSRGRAMGLVSTIGPLGAVSGPPVGGFLVEQLGWSWIFFSNVPVSLAVIALALPQLPPDRPVRWPRPEFAVDAALLGGAASAILIGLTLSASKGVHWLGLIVTAVPLLVVWTRLPQSEPVRRLIPAPGLVEPHVALLGSAAATGLALFLLPFYLQNQLGVPASVAGSTILALPAMLAIVGPLGGWLADLWGARATALTGAVITAAGLLIVAPLAPGWTPGDIAWRLAILGIGGGLFGGPVLTLAMSRAPADLLGTTGASTSLTRQLGFALGPALATSVWSMSGYSVAGMRGALVAAAVVGGASALALTRVRTDQSAPPGAADALAGTPHA